MVNNKKRLRIIIDCKPTLENEELIKWLDEGTHRHFALKKILTNMMNLAKNKLGENSNITDLFNDLISSSLTTLENHPSEEEQQTEYLTTANVKYKAKTTNSELNQVQSEIEDKTTQTANNITDNANINSQNTATIDNINDNAVKRDVNTPNEVNQPVDLNTLAQNYHEVGVSDEDEDEDDEVDKQQMFNDIKNLFGK